MKKHLISVILSGALMLGMGAVCLGQSPAPPASTPAVSEPAPEPPAVDVNVTTTETHTAPDPVVIMAPAPAATSTSSSSSTKDSTHILSPVVPATGTDYTGAYILGGIAVLAVIVLLAMGMSRRTTTSTSVTRTAR